MKDKRIKNNRQEFSNKTGNRMLVMTVVFSAFCAFFTIPGFSSYTEVLKQGNLILKSEEIPQGMRFGKIPGPAQKIIKANPWTLDREAVRKFSRAIYSSANADVIKKMVMVILAPKEFPFRDDIVYYGFEFSSKETAKAENSKLAEVAKFNPNRAILLSNEKRSILLFSDNEALFPAMQNLSKLLEKKLHDQ